MARTLLLGALAAGLMASAQAAPAAGDPGAHTLQLLQDQKTPPVTKGETQKGDAKKDQEKKGEDKKDGESKKKEKKDEVTVWILDASGKG